MPPKCVPQGQYICLCAHPDNTAVSIVYLKELENKVATLTAALNEADQYCEELRQRLGFI